ncbi:MAG: hypothetical protein HY301_00395 [Verrucomicrobia bacterium]|nr:hypothetical protein [Verrucomicrobiota bacterium]
MITNDQELEVTQARIRQFEQQVALIRKTAADTKSYRLSASGFLSEIDRMNLEIREYLWSDPAKDSLAAS